MEATRAALQRLTEARMMLPVVRTERLVLRPWREEDRAPFAALCADPEVMAFFPAPLTAAEADARVDRFRLDAARHGIGMWAVEARDTRVFVGMLGFDVVNFEAAFTPAVEIGWRFARAFWGQGLAFEAAKAALHEAFNRYRLPEVVSFTATQNERSWRLMERLGMERVGAFEHPRVPEGHPLRPHALYRLLAPAAVAPAQGAVVSSAPASARPRAWIDGDGCPRGAKELFFRAAQRGAIDVVLVANSAVSIPTHPRVRSVRVPKGMDVADDWLVANAPARDLVLTSDVPLAAELVAKGVAVVSPRGEWFLPSNIGEKLSMRDFFTEARASGMVEGGGPAPYDDRAKKGLADALNGWIHKRTRELAGEA
jgi:ribosomal-protein-alanine N-acetyltransferase